MTEDLIQKLLISKKIMDRHKEMPRGQVSESSYGEHTTTQPLVEDFAPVQGKYNIPEEFSPSPTVSKPVVPKGGTPKERIMSSKLPDSIKKLMIEHPISQPAQSGGPVLSNELVEKASRLMKENAPHQEQEKRKSNVLPSPTYNNTDLKEMIKETMMEILSENGLLVENVTKSNDVFTFRVGQHIFEGKVTKIKKVK